MKETHMTSLVASLILVTLLVSEISSEVKITPRESETKIEGDMFLVLCSDSEGLPVTWTNPRGAPLGIRTHPAIHTAPFGTSIVFNRTRGEDGGIYTCSNGKEEKHFRLSVEGLRARLPMRYGRPKPKSKPNRNRNNYRHDNRIHTYDDNDDVDDKPEYDEDNIDVEEAPEENDNAGKAEEGNEENDPEDNDPEEDNPEEDNPDENENNDDEANGNDERGDEEDDMNEDYQEYDTPDEEDDDDNTKTEGTNSSFDVGDSDVDVSEDNVDALSSSDNENDQNSNIENDNTDDNNADPEENENDDDNKDDDNVSSVDDIDNDENNGDDDNTDEIDDIGDDDLVESDVDDEDNGEDDLDSDTIGNANDSSKKRKPPPLKFMDSPTAQAAIEGKDFTIRCEVKGGNVTWSVQDGDLQDPRYRILGDGLYIEKVNRTDTRTYICKAVQISTGTIEDRKIKFTVRHKPSLPYSVYAKQEQAWGYPGSTVNLTCEVEAEPAPKFEWFKRHKKINLTHTGRVLNVSSHISVLQMMVDKNTFGDYKCVAKNELGKLEKYFSLEEGVKPEPPDFIELRGDNSDLLDLGIHPPKTGESVPSGMEPLGYHVQFREINEEDWNEQYFNISSENSYPIKSLKPDTAYEVKAATRNLAGFSDYTNSSTFRTLKNFAESIHHTAMSLPELVSLIVFFGMW